MYALHSKGEIKYLADVKSGRKGTLISLKSVFIAHYWGPHYPMKELITPFTGMSAFRRQQGIRRQKKS